MTNPDEEGAGLERLLAILAKLYAAVEMSGNKSPLCVRRLTHSTDCPLGIAWRMLDEELHDEARKAVSDRAERHEVEADWPNFLGEE